MHYFNGVMIPVSDFQKQCLENGKISRQRTKHKLKSILKCTYISLAMEEFLDMDFGDKS